MHKNIIFCDGGLANRLNALLFGLILKNKFGGDWALSWPVNNWCGADFNDLFSIGIDVYNNSLQYYKKNIGSFIPVMHENQIGFNEDSIIYHKDLGGYSDYENILSNGRPIFYYHNSIPPFVDIAEINSSIKTLNINPKILSSAHSFCIKNKINDSVFGIHIRKTDFGNNVDDTLIYNTIVQSNNNFFVCSDDKNVNDRFSKLKNCYVFEKNYFPEKINAESDWNGAITDDQNRLFNYNIKRSALSVQEALVDLLILSKTTQILTSHSTFLRMSMIFKAVNFSNF